MPPPTPCAREKPRPRGCGGKGTHRLGLCIGWLLWLRAIDHLLIVVLDHYAVHELRLLLGLGSG